MAYSEAAEYYFVEFDTTDELNLLQGKINYRIYGYKDEAGNVGVDLTQDNTTSKEYPYVIYDSVAPVYSSLGITDLDEFKDEVGKLYVKNGDTVRVLVYFDEKLAVEPTVKIGNKEFKATYREESSKNQPAYYADVKITDELGLTDGVINFEVYGYSDISGNTGKVLTNEDINMSSYPSVTLDNTTPEAIGLRMTGGEVVDENGEKVWYVSKDDKIYFYVEFAEELAVSPKLKINDAIVVDFNNGLYKDDRYIYAAIYTVKEDDALQDGTLAIEVYGYADQAGNVGQVLKNEDITLPSQKNIVVDKTAPTFNIMDGMVTNDNVLVEVTDTNYTYTSITNVTSTNQTNTRFTLESTGVHTLVAYDKAGNSTTITLTIDKVNPEIILPEGVIGLNKNEKHIEAGSTLSLEGLVQAKDNLDENVKLELKYVTFYAPSGLKEDNIYNYDFSNGIDTKKVGRYNLDYVATDAAGNVAKKTLLIMISDTTKPVISIDRTVELNVGDDFVEDIRSKISDNSDDTLKVEIYPVNGKEVNTTQAGTYQINYKISDTSGNYEVATRTVIVK